MFFGALVSELGTVIYSFAVGFYILEITQNNAFTQGLYLALCGAILLIFTPIGGILGDRFNKARIMSICDYIKGGLIILGTILMLMFKDESAHLGILFVVGFLANLVSGIFNPASGALLPSILEEEKLQQANSYFSAKSALQGILGVVLAGILYGTLSVTTLFFMVGICYVLSGVSEMFIRYTHVQKEEKLNARVALDDMKEAFNYFKAQKAILAIMGASLFFNFFLSPITSNFIPYFVKTDVATAPSYLFDKILTPELWSSVFSVLFGLSVMAGSIIMSGREQQDKIGHSTAIRACFMSVLFILCAAGYGILVAGGVSLNGFLILFSTLCLIIGIFIAFINIPFSTALMRVVDKDKLSKVTSFLSILSQGLVPISSIFAGAVLRLAGSTTLLAISAAGITITALLLLFNKDAKSI